MAAAGARRGALTTLPPVTDWPPLSSRRRPDVLAGLDKAPTEKVTPRIAAELHWRITYQCALWASEHDVAEVSPSAGSEWLTRLGLAHIDDPDLCRLVHPAGRYDPHQLRLPDGESPAGGAAAEGWDVDLGGQVRAIGVRWPPALLDAITITLRDWRAAHPITVAVFGGAGLARQGFIEGLLRLGMKHVNDPRGDALMRQL